MSDQFPWARGGAEVDHVGFLVEDFGPIAALFGDQLGMEVSEPEALGDLGLEVLWVQWGDVAFEFLAPTDPDVPAAARLRRRGPGLDHIAVRADSVADSIEWCREQGVPLLDQAPRPGAKGATVAFLDPDAVAGTRIELVQPATEES